MSEQDFLDLPDGHDCSYTPANPYIMKIMVRTLPQILRDGVVVGDVAYLVKVFAVFTVYSEEYVPLRAFAFSFICNLSYLSNLLNKEAFVFS